MKDWKSIFLFLTLAFLAGFGVVFIPTNASWPCLGSTRKLLILQMTPAFL